MGTFDAPAHMRKIRTRQGMQDYLDVKWRVAWLRSEQPDAQIITEQIDGSDSYARFKCVINIPATGAIATGHGSETAGDFPDFYEKAECVREDTEILTETGWKKYTDLLIGEPVLAYDAANDRAEWVPLERVVSYEDAPLVRLFNGWAFDALCTPNHSWAVYTSAITGGKRYEYRRLKPLDELRSGHIITASAAPSGASSVTPSQAAVMGWALTDGTFRHRMDGKIARIIIFQSKVHRVAEIDALIADIPHTRAEGSPYTRTFPSGKTSECLAGVQWCINAEAAQGLFAALSVQHENEVDIIIPLMTEEARRAMLGAMMAADGDARGNFGKIQKPWVMKTFALLCALEGYALPAIKWHNDFPTQRVKRTRRTDVSRLQREDAGHGTVWCPTTKHGTWYARFANGMTTITGNTKAIGRACATLGYGTDAATDFDDGVPMDGAAAAKGEGDRQLEPQDRAAVEQQHERNTAPPPPPPMRLNEPRKRPEPDGQERVRQTVERTCEERGIPVLHDDTYATIAESVNRALFNASKGIEVRTDAHGNVTPGDILNALMALKTPVAAGR